MRVLWALFAWPRHHTPIQQAMYAILVKIEKQSSALALQISKLLIICHGCKFDWGQATRWVAKALGKA